MAFALFMTLPQARGSDPAADPRAGGMQTADDRCADALRAAGDQCDAAGEWRRGISVGFHEGLSL